MGEEPSKARGDLDLQPPKIHLHSASFALIHEYVFVGKSGDISVSKNNSHS